MKRLLLVVALIVSAVIPKAASPQVSACSFLQKNPLPRAVAFETITVSTTAIGFTAANVALASAGAIAYPATNGPFRYRSDGTNPTSTVGMGPYTTPVTVCVQGGDVGAIRFIRDTTATVDVAMPVTYYAANP